MGLGTTHTNKGTEQQNNPASTTSTASAVEAMAAANRLRLKQQEQLLGRDQPLGQDIYETVTFPERLQKEVNNKHMGAGNLEQTGMDYAIDQVRKVTKSHRDLHAVHVQLEAHLQQHPAIQRNAPGFDNPSNIAGNMTTLQRWWEQHVFTAEA